MRYRVKITTEVKWMNVETEESDGKMWYGVIQDNNERQQIGVGRKLNGCKFVVWIGGCKCGNEGSRVVRWTDFVWSEWLQDWWKKRKQVCKLNGCKFGKIRCVSRWMQIWKDLEVQCAVWKTTGKIQVWEKNIFGERGRKYWSIERIETKVKYEWGYKPMGQA